MGLGYLIQPHSHAQKIGTAPRNFGTVPKLFWHGTPNFQGANILRV